MSQMYLTNEFQLKNTVENNISNEYFETICKIAATLVD